jgi:transcriptional regulator with XRE-family HTH domain
MKTEIIYKVDQIRIEKNISKKQLAKLTGIEYNVLSGFLNQKRNTNPKISTLIRYAQALNVEVKELFEVKIIEDESNK